MLPFADVLERLPVPQLRRARMARGAARRDHLRHDRRPPGERPRSRRPAVDAARRAGRRRRRRDDRPAGARRGDDDLSRRPRDDGQRADVDLVSAQRRARRRGEAARRGRPRAAGPAADDRRTCRRCRTSSAWSPSRCGCIRRRGSSAAARSTSIRLGDVRRAAAIDPRDEPVRHAARPALLRRIRSASIPIAGRRSSARRCRSSPTSRSAAARASASASRSPGWS